jgi:hypothetical protein
MREDFAREQFPIDEPAGRYAAANAHAWSSFSFDQYRYSDDRLSAWIRELGDILFGRNGAPSVEQLRETYLSLAERRKVEAEQAKQLRDGDL